MARARNIKPGFFKNEDLAECSVWARLLFPGLWMLADREGRLEDRPKRIKGEIFPFDAIEAEPLLVELVDWGFIHRYVADGKRCIQIRNFSVHQSPHGTEKDSELPDESGAYTVNERAKNGCITGKISQNKGYAKAQTVSPPLNNGAATVSPPLDNGAATVSPPLDNALNPDSLNPDSLNPDSLNPDSLNPDSLIHKAHVATAPCAPVKQERGADKNYSEDFNHAFAAYPKRLGDNPKEKAFAAWKARLRDGATVDEMTSGVNRYAAYCESASSIGTQYVKQAATFFGPEKPFLETWEKQKSLGDRRSHNQGSLKNNGVNLTHDDFTNKNYGQSTATLPWEH